MKKYIKSEQEIVQDLDNIVYRELVKQFAIDAWKEIKAAGPGEIFLYDYLEKQARRLGLDK